eukprot:scaffold254509_cov24-Attheya_sp.AAC.1
MRTEFRWSSTPKLPKTGKSSTTSPTSHNLDQPSAACSSQPVKIARTTPTTSTAPLTYPNFRS